MYLDSAGSDKAWIIDIETHSLTPTVIWCLCAINLGTGEEVTLTDPDEMRNWINERLTEGSTFIGHNIISFDIPVLNRLLGTRIASRRLVDTFVLSMLYSPALAGGHSLEAWGERLRFPKTEFNDWSRLSDDMVRYCLNDCRVNLQLYLRLSDRMVGVGFSERSCEIESLAWALIQRQRKNGFQLDVPRAHELYSEIRQLERQLKDEIYEQWPPQLLEVKRFAKAFKADGSPTSNYGRHVEQYPRLELCEDGGYCAFDYVEFNLGSPKQRIEKLLELGWKPREFTPKGAPQATRKGSLVPSLEEFLQKNPNEAARKLAEWIAINARGNMISTWIDVADDKGLIHGNLWLAGSLRYRHDKPNTANIPAIRLDDNKVSVFGRAGGFTYESRDLWTVRDRERRSLVGVDAKGVQLRILAHYLGNSTFSENILSEDPHEANRKSMGLPSRSLTKTITYATLMGAGDARIAMEAKVSMREAVAAKEQFFSQVPELPALIRRLKQQLNKTGRLELCDGAQVLVPSDHMVIPYLLQGDESRLMKQSMIYVADAVRKEKLDVLKVGDIHDEHQYDALNNHVNPFLKILPVSFSRAGESFGYTVPIECDAKVGLTWSQTH